MMIDKDWELAREERLLAGHRWPAQPSPPSPLPAGEGIAAEKDLGK